jgi:hypothetical protein
MRIPLSKTHRHTATVAQVVFAAILAAILPLRARAVAAELSFSPTNLRYGYVVVGRTESLLVTITNNGGASVTISRVGSSSRNYKISQLKLPKVLAAGRSLDLNVTFAPTATGWRGGYVTVVSNASNRILDLGLGGSGVNKELVTASPANLSFGKVSMGESATLPVVLTNTRTWKVTLKQLQVSGSAFSVRGATFPLTLAAGQKVKLQANFTPKVEGLTGGSLFVTGPALDIPVTGTGITTSKPKLTITPAVLTFGNVVAGTTETLTARLSASGASVTISLISSNSSRFAIPGLEFPLTIPAGKELFLNVAFTPQKNGEKSATLSFSCTAANCPASQPLTGTGTSPYVDLSWTASRSQVTGYNVYRKSSNGSYTKINSRLDPNTTYTDATIVADTTYYYATTAVDSSGHESAYSNQVEVVVP